MKSAMLGAGLLLGAVSVLAQPASEPGKAPGLAIGAKAPEAQLRTIDNEAVKLSSLYEKGPVVIAFYRGGWCPYCNKELTEWQGRVEDLKAAGATLVAITPEKPSKVKDTMKKDHLDFKILSDAKLEAAKGFKVFFTLDAATQKKYKSFGADLEQWNASGTWDLPAPGTFVIDQTGTVRYAFADWDYKKRARPDDVIAAVKALGKDGKK